MASQEVEQPELLGTQMQRPAVAMQFARVKIELEAIDDPQPVTVARLARLLRQERQATAQLFGVNVDGQCRIKTGAQGPEPFSDPVMTIEQHRAQARTPASLGSHQVQLDGRPWRDAQDDHGGAVSEQCSSEDSQFLGDAQPHAGPSRL